MHRSQQNLLNRKKPNPPRYTWDLTKEKRHTAAQKWLVERRQLEDMNVSLLNHLWVHGFQPICSQVLHNHGIVGLTPVIGNHNAESFCMWAFRVICTLIFEKELYLFSPIFTSKNNGNYSTTTTVVALHKAQNIHFSGQLVDCWKVAINFCWILFT